MVPSVRVDWLWDSDSTDAPWVSGGWDGFAEETQVVLKSQAPVVETAPVLETWVCRARGAHPGAQPVPGDCWPRWTSRPVPLSSGEGGLSVQYCEDTPSCTFKRQ